MIVDHTIDDGKRCIDCAHARPNRWYPPDYRMCAASEVVRHHGGPRDCGWMRSYRGLCKPEAKFYRRKR